MFLKSKRNVLILCVMALPVIIYLYFLPWKTNTIYGDDLYIFKDLSNSKGILEMIRLSMVSGKFRPMHVLSSRIIFDLFHKNLSDYYLFNVAVQSINSCLVAILLNTVLRSTILSFAFGLFYGLSRFSLYNITQLFCGGALEGLALTFFLLSLFFILRIMERKDISSSQFFIAFLWSILFANLGMFTHERYIVLFPFIITVALFFPAQQMLEKKHRIAVCFLAVASVLSNIIIKKYVYSAPFFVGTGGKSISFSLSSAFAFFADALMSIFQVNSKPEYLTGLSFASLPVPAKAIMSFLVSGVILMVFVYFWQTLKFFSSRNAEKKKRFFIFLFLCLLFTLSLGPAVVTIRLEQRWLQASFSIFILLLAIAWIDLDYKSSLSKIIAYAWISVFLLVPNYYYLKFGAKNLYFKDAEKMAAFFVTATNLNVIHKNVSTVYLVKNNTDDNANSGLAWAIADGYLFHFYQGKSKKLIFVDSVSVQATDKSSSPLKNFNIDNSQVIYVNNIVIDVTDQYLKDSLKSFKY